jgi:4-hydroxy-3-polyprenylbenzoate decarboxylase
MARDVESTICDLRQYKTYTKTPISIISIDKKEKIKEIFSRLKSLKPYTKLVIFVDKNKNNLNNPYMLLWRIVNNIDASRDIFLEKEFIGVDATNKGLVEGFARRWPDDTDCDMQIIEDLRSRGLLEVSDDFLKKYYI